MQRQNYEDLYGKKTFLSSIWKYERIVSKKILTWTPLSVYLSSLWFLERLRAIPLSFSSIALSIRIYIEESNGTKTQRNHSQSLQKPQWRQVNRLRSSGKDFFIDNPFEFSNWRKKRFFPIQILIILPLHNDQRSAGLISHIAWGTCVHTWIIDVYMTNACQTCI